MKHKSCEGCFHRQEVVSEIEVKPDKDSTATLRRVAFWLQKIFQCAKANT